MSGHRPLDYRTLTVPAGPTSGDVWKVGGAAEAFPHRGWLVWTRAVGGAAGTTLRASLSLFAPWQGSAALYRIDAIEWAQGGMLWIPWPRFEIAWADIASAGATSTIQAAACPVPADMPLTPGSATVYSNTERTNLDVSGGAAPTATIALPDGATRYLLGIDPAAAWAGPLTVEERGTRAGSTPVCGAFALNNNSGTVPMRSGGWLPVPPRPGTLLISNTDAAAEIDFSIRWRHDLAELNR